MISVRIQSPALTVEVSSFGAELRSVKANNGTEYLWQGGSAWNRCAPVLFPIVGRLKNDTYLYKGNTYKMSQHGFARDREFKLVEKSDSACTFELVADERTLEIYPFNFSLRISYTVKDNSVTCSYLVGNGGKQLMYFSIGAHPGFRCPLEKGEQFGDYAVQFQQRAFLQTRLRDGLRTNDTRVLPLEGKNLRLSSTLFDDDALVFENGQVDRVTLLSNLSGRSVQLDCAGWPYFGIWSKKGNKEFVCLEPWYGIAGHADKDQELGKKDGILRLEAGSHFSCQYSFSIT